MEPLNGQRPTSYQSISSAADKEAVSPANATCGTGVLSPMESLTRRDRWYRKLIGGLLLSILIMLGSMVYFSRRPASNRNGNAFDRDAYNNAFNADLLLREEQQERAKTVLHAINHHHHRQHIAMPNGCETTLLILRHCEKYGKDAIDENGDDHCNYIGYQRAEYIATLFGNETRWPIPTQLFALTEIRENNKNYREWETLRPLSKLVGVDIEMIPSDSSVFAQGTYIPLLQEGYLCGQVIVVAWKHSLFPNLANAVGCGPDQGCPTAHPEDDFDTVWQIKFVFDPPIATVHPYKRLSPKPHWFVYGNLAAQGFDPLAFRKSPTLSGRNGR